MAAKKAAPKVNPYIGWDKDAEGKRAGTEKLMDLCKRRWRAEDWGTWQVRKMRGSNNPSVHGTARALDFMIADKDAKAEAIAFFTRPDVVEALGIQELHVYRCKESKWGKGWRIGRGWKVWTEKDNGGTAGYPHLHLELDYKLCDNAAAMDKAFRALPRS
jgi:hypothetical protein